MKNKGIRQIDSSVEHSNDPEWPSTTMAIENSRSASMPIFRWGVFTVCKQHNSTRGNRPRVLFYVVLKNVTTNRLQVWRMGFVRSISHKITIDGVRFADELFWNEIGQ